MLPFESSEPIYVFAAPSLIGGPGAGRAMLPTPPASTKLIVLPNFQPLPLKECYECEMRICVVLTNPLTTPHRLKGRFRTPRSPKVFLLSPRSVVLARATCTVRVPTVRVPTALLGSEKKQDKRVSSFEGMACKFTRNIA